MDKADIYSFLAEHRLGVLGTVNQYGDPQSALMGIAFTPQVEIIFDTLRSSRKYPNLISHPTCSFVIGGWDGDQTVQYEGQAEQLESSELERCQEIYFKVWPDGVARIHWPEIVYFVVRPKWIRYSDFSVSPPVIHEFHL